MSRGQQNALPTKHTLNLEPTVCTPAINTKVGTRREEGVPHLHGVGSAVGKAPHDLVATVGVLEGGRKGDPRREVPVAGGCEGALKRADAFLETDRQRNDNDKKKKKMREKKWGGKVFGYWRRQTYTYTWQGWQVKQEAGKKAFRVLY